jgi:hypothetical protein
MLPGASRELDVAVKYIDTAGREHGPYELRFDPKKAFVAETKQVLGMTSWISFREYPPGTLLAYFTHLLSYKNAFREIRYSLGDESLSKSLHFTPDWAGAAPRLLDDDEIYVEIPLSTEFVAVKLFYIDGSESELKRFILAEVGVDRN